MVLYIAATKWCLYELIPVKAGVRYVMLKQALYQGEHARALLYVLYLVLG